MRNGTCGCVPEIYAQIDEQNIENRFGAYFFFFFFVSQRNRRMKYLQI